MRGRVGLAVGGMVALAAAVGVSRFVYTPILPVMASSLGLSAGHAGLIASANFLGYLLGALLAAVPGLPWSRRAWLLGALAVSGATTAAMGVVSSLDWFLVLRFLGGGASAFVLVLASALVLDGLAAAGRMGLASVHFAGVGMGIAVSAVVVSGLLAGGADWRVLWLVAGAMVLAAVVVVGLLVPGDAGRAVAGGGRAVTRMGGGLVRLIVAYGLVGFGYVVTATFLVAIVRGSSAAPFVWVVVGVTAAPSVAVWVRIGDRIGLRAAFGVACLVEAVGVVASVVSVSAVGALVAAALLGGTFMGLTALGLAEARVLAAGNPRPAFALMTAAFGLGQVAGPMLAGLLSDRMGGFGIPSLLAAAALVGAALVVGTGRGVLPVRAAA